MSTNQQPAAAQAPAGMRGDIQKQWSKFTYAEVSALKSKDDLVGQVQTKYALDRAQAQKDVDAFAKGRQL
jgi:predicted site-specific integrase-resolvase